MENEGMEEVSPAGETLLQRVNRLMGRKGLVRKMCRDLGLSRSTVDNWRSPDANPSCDTVYKIAQYLNVTVEYLWTGKDGENTTPEDLRAIEKFKKLPDSDRRSVIMLINGLYGSRGS